MDIYVVYQPEALDVRDISGHILDYLDHRYGRAHVSGTGRAGDAKAHERARARSRVVIALIGPSWASSADARVEWELAQALARRKMIVPTLLGGAALPPPTTPGLAALATRQAVTVRPDPDMAEDLNRLFDEVNTQLSWAPMSGGLLAGSALLALLIGLILWFARAGQYTLLVFIFLPSVPLEALLLGAALWLAWQRRTRWWAAALVASVPAAGVEIVIAFWGTLRWPVWLNTLALVVYPLTLLAFALLGPRRELQRLTPPRVRLPAPRRAAPQPR